MVDRKYVRTSRRDVGIKGEGDGDDEGKNRFDFTPTCSGSPVHCAHQANAGTQNTVQALTRTTSFSDGGAPDRRNCLRFTDLLPREARPSSDFCNGPLLSLPPPSSEDVEEEDAQRRWCW